MCTMLSKEHLHVDRILELAFADFNGLSEALLALLYTIFTYPHSLQTVFRFFGSGAAVVQQWMQGGLDLAPVRSIR